MSPRPPNVPPDFDGGHFALSWDYPKEGGYYENRAQTEVMMASIRNLGGGMSREDFAQHKEYIRCLNEMDRYAFEVAQSPSRNRLLRLCIATAGGRRPRRPHPATGLLDPEKGMIEVACDLA